MKLIIKLKITYQVIHVNPKNAFEIEEALQARHGSNTESSSAQASAAGILEYFNVKIDFRNAACGADFKS